MFDWVDASEAQRFAVSLADFFAERIPLDSLDKKRKSMEKKREVLDKMFLQIARFRTEHKLNIYKKAKLGNAFKWRLNDRGYDPVFVDELTKALMLKL